MKPFILALTVLLTHTTSAQALDVVTSIKPLQLLTQELIDTDDQLTLLLPAMASPHDYQMRPSDMRKLQQADLFLWIGPQMERFLARPLRSALTSEKRLALLDTDGLHLRYGGHHHEETHQADSDRDEHGHDEPAHDRRSHSDHPHDEQKSENTAVSNPANLDPHIWLSPVNADKVARRISATLQRLNPEKANQYRHNLEQFLLRLHQTDKIIRAKIEPLHNQGYIVFHDAFGYFEQHFGLEHEAAFTPSPERRPGAQQIGLIRQLLQTRQATCLFTEPQFKSPLIRTVAQGLTINQVELDPMAGNIGITGGYTAMLADLGERFSQCLKPQGEN